MLFRKTPEHKSRVIEIEPSRALDITILYLEKRCRPYRGSGFHPACGKAGVSAIRQPFAMVCGSPETGAFPQAP